MALLSVVSYGVLGQLWYLIVSITDICLLVYIDIFKGLSGVIFSVQFILPNVTDCQLKDHLHTSTEAVSNFEPLLAETKCCCFFTDLYCAGVSYKYCLIPLFFDSLSSMQILPKSAWYMYVLPCPVRYQPSFKQQHNNEL